MQLIKGDKYKKIEVILLLAFLCGAYLVLNLISMTDGDDAYFSKLAKSMNVFDYLTMRYQQWEGRMTSEAMAYITFRFGKNFWEVVNAVMQLLLPAGIFHLLQIMLPKADGERRFYLFLGVFASLLFMDLDVMGYSAFWMTGSVFYLWSTVAGIWAVMPFVSLVFQPEKQSKWSFLYTLPCGFIAAMGLEQIAAVVITFGFIAVSYHYIREKKIAWLHLLQVLLMITALYLLFISPGTSIRRETEINIWLPQFAELSVGHHLFLTFQWLMSALANESKVYFIMIWLIAAYLLLKRRDKKTRLLAVGTFVFSVVAALPYVGVDYFSEMGMGITDITAPVTQVAEPGSLSVQNIVAMCWWSVAFLYTLLVLWHCFSTRRDRITALLLLLAGFASAAIMYLSPTIYASGARVLFVTEILLWIVCAWMFGAIEDLEVKKRGILFFVLVSIVGLISQSDYLLRMLGLG